jgi:hypothetical protein
MFWDLDGDDRLDEITLSNALDLHLPAARRKYYAIEFQLEKLLADHWFLEASYTWAQSYGNTEGLLRSDLRQADTGITASFDAPELQINADGRLPNDRRHTLKVFGAYQWNDRLTVGAHALLQSGRPLNALGNPSNPDLWPAYFGTYFEVPQGSAGRTPWLFNLDLSCSYQASPQLRFGLTVFNVLGLDRATRVYEVRTGPDGQPDPRYGRPLQLQAPRTVRLSAAYRF